MEDLMLKTLLFLKKSGQSQKKSKNKIMNP